MTFLAHRLKNIKPSPTVAITAKANEMKAAGADIIPLAAGEPDFDTPAHIIEAAKRALDEGKTRYAAPAGELKLRQAIQQKFARENSLDYGTDEICVGAGGKQILFNAFFATINEGDEVIIPAPYWVSYPDIVLLAGGKPVIVPCDQDHDFKITAEQLQSAISPKTKWLMLNSPCNPTGMAYERKELEGLIAVLQKPENSHVHVMCDDIYEHLTYDGFEFYTMATLADDTLKQRILTVNGLSKTFAMTGWRIGYAAGPKDLIKAMVKLNSQSITSPTTFVQWAAAEALSAPQDFVKRNNEVFKKRRDFVVAALNQMDGIECTTPLGAFYVYPSCKGVIGKTTPNGKRIENDTDFIAYILESEGLAAVQGAAFGLEPYFRISYATSDAILAEAMTRLHRAVSALR